MTSRPDKNKPRRPANWRTRRLVGSIVIFVVIEVLTGITLFLWPKVYEATASLQLEPVAKSEPQHETPEARVAALEKALYEWKGLEKFVAKWGECEEKAQSASSCLARTARIEPAGGLSYNITVRSSTSRHARDAANALAKQLAELTPSVFVTKSDDEQALVRAKAELSRAEQAIADFKAVHPGVVEEAPSKAADAAGSLSNLVAEKQALQGKIQNSKQANQDNPYADATETRHLEQRLRYVEQAIKVQQGKGKGATKPQPQVKGKHKGPALADELSGLIAAETRARHSVDTLSENSGPTPSMTARVLPGDEPMDSVEPNRPLLGFVGTWLAMAAVGAWWTTVTAAHRRRKAAVRAAIVERAKQRVASSNASFVDQRMGRAPISDRMETETATIRSVRVRSDWKPEAGSAAPTDRLLALAQELVERSRQKHQVVLLMAPTGSARLKSLSAARLGINIAKRHQQTVLLLEAEFLKPQLQRILKLNLPSGAGFSQQLHTRIHEPERRELTVLECTDHLHALVEGRVRCPGLILSLEFANTIAELSQRYPLVLIDAPVDPSDVERRALEDVVDAVVVVLDEEDRSNAHPAEAGPLAGKVLRTLTVSA